jgi:hypothetical protein
LWPVAQFTEDLQGMMTTGCGRRIVAGHSLQYAKAAKGLGQTEPVTQPAVQVQGVSQARFGGGVGTGLLLRVTQNLQGARFGTLVAASAGQCQRSPVACDWCRVVARPSLHDAQLAEGEGLAGQVTDVGIERDRLGQAGRRGGVFRR